MLHCLEAGWSVFHYVLASAETFQQEEVHCSSLVCELQSSNLLINNFNLVFKLQWQWWTIIKKRFKIQTNFKSNDQIWNKFRSNNKIRNFFVSLKTLEKNIKLSINKNKFRRDFIRKIKQNKIYERKTIMWSSFLPKWKVFKKRRRNGEKKPLLNWDL